MNTDLPNFVEQAEKLASEFKKIGLAIQNFCEEIRPALPKEEALPDSAKLQPATYTILPDYLNDSEDDWLNEETIPTMILTEGMDILEADNQITWWIKDGSLKVNRAELLQQWKSEVMAGGTTMGLVEWAKIIFMIPDSQGCEPS